MPDVKVRWLAWLAAITVLAACAAPQADPGGAAGESPKPSSPKRVAAAIMGNAHTVYQKLNPGSNVPGIETLQELLHAGLANQDNKGDPRPQLAQSVPTLENGLWKVFPDGRMETTWHIRDAQWHDGAPFTSADLVFTAQVVQDRQLPVLRDATFPMIESVEAPDPRTLVVTWKQPLIDADRVFSQGSAAPLPQHLLERTFSEDKAGFLELGYWSDGFVGTGPFVLKEFVRGSRLVAQANEHYVLGRPKIDEVVVNFIPDPTALVANMLAGQVELLLGRGLSLEQGLQMRDQWKDGKMITDFPATWMQLMPQFLNASPAVVTNLEFRRALLHAIDRQEMVDSIQAGLANVAHSLLSPNQPGYQDIEARLPRYDYDPRKATQMIEGLGYRKGLDGLFHDSANQGLGLELRTDNQDIDQKTMFSVANYWQRLGIRMDPVVYPPQRVTDLEYLYTFPAFTILRLPNGERSLRSRHSSQTPLPETGFAGGNRPRYRNPDFDALLDRYFATIPKPQRITVLGEIIYHMADQLPVMGMYYDLNPSLIGNRMVNVDAIGRPGSTHAWNVEQWDVK